MRLQNLPERTAGARDLARGLLTCFTMRLPVCCCLLLLVAGIRGQEHDDFKLDDAVGPDELATTLKPQPGEGGHTPDILDDFNFDHAGGLDITKKPTPKPQPGVGDRIPKKPTPKPQPGGGGDEFDLGDALKGDDIPNNPAPKPRPDQGGGGGGGDFGDVDLGELGPEDRSGHDDKPPKGEDGQGQGEGNQSVLAGVVSAVAVAAVGAVSSFIAYQKKKLCFKGNADDPENVNMDSHKGDQSEPQAQSTLLAK